MAAGKKTLPKKRPTALAALTNDTKEKEAKGRQRARTQCTFCKAKGHLVHQCRKRLSTLRGRAGSSSEDSSAAPAAGQEAPAMIGGSNRQECTLTNIGEADMLLLWPTGSSRRTVIG